MAQTQVSIDDLSNDQLKELGIKRPRKQQFSKEGVRSWSLKVLAQISDLTQDQRRRVLEHALNVNRM